MHCMEGFVPVALALAGARNVRIRCTRLPGREGESPARLIAFKIHVSWEGAGALAIPPRTPRCIRVPRVGGDEETTSA